MYLSIENIDYSYTNQKDQKILENMHYQFKTGYVYAIQGKSGTGKTTLLSLLAGLDEPQKGRITIDGQDIRDQGYRHHRKNNVSIIFQNYNLIDYLTALENIRLSNRKANANDLFEMGLSQEAIQRNVLHLSGGQQQRVAIARALASPAPFILADEPTGNLDEDNAQAIMDILKKIAHEEKKCVILVTHSRKIAKQADVILRLQKKGLRELKSEI